MQFERWVDLHLDGGRTAAIDLGPILYVGDNKPLRLGVRLYDADGEVDVPDDGVSGWAIIASGETISPFTGGNDGNKGWIDVPQAALVTPGRVEIFLRITDGNDMTVSLYATGTVKRTTTGTVVNPGTVIPNVDQLNTAAAQCIAATEAAQAALTDAVTATVNGTTLVISALT